MGTYIKNHILRRKHKRKISNKKCSVKEKINTSGDNFKKKEHETAEKIITAEDRQKTEDYITAADDVHKTAQIKSDKSLCEKETLETKMITECSSEPVKQILNTGFFYAKIPVILSEALIHIDIENEINLPKPSIGIKSIKRRAVIRRYDLILEAKKLFIDGTVIKSIDYSEAVFNSSSEMKGQIKNITVAIPFECVTKVEYTNNPLALNKKSETRLYTNKDDENIYTESYNEEERIYCELIRASFEEINIINDKNNIKSGKMHIFEKVSQKMSMHLTIRLYQNQNVSILSQK